MQDIKILTGQVEQLKKEIKYLAKVTIPALGNGGENSSDVQSQIDNLSSSISQLTSQLTSVQNNLTTLSTEVENLSDSIANVGGSEVVDVIYDKSSEDEAVNLGYTDGIVGNSILTFDFSVYKRVILYGSLNSCDCSTVINLEGRLHTDATLHTAGTLLSRYYYMKVVIPATKDKLSVNYACEYYYNAASGLIEFTRTKSNAIYYLYRIEGIK